MDIFSGLSLSLVVLFFYDFSLTNDISSFISNEKYSIAKHFYVRIEWKTLFEIFPLCSSSPYFFLVSLLFSSFHLIYFVFLESWELPAADEERTRSASGTRSLWRPVSSSVSLSLFCVRLAIADDPNEIALNQSNHILLARLVKCVFFLYGQIFRFTIPIRSKYSQSSTHRKQIEPNSQKAVRKIVWLIRKRRLESYQRRQVITQIKTE